MAVKTLKPLVDDGDIIDLDAGRREAQARPVRVKLRGTVFELPAQLPAAVFDPILDGDFDALLGVLVEAIQGEATDDEGFVNRGLAVLAENPRLPLDVITALKGTLEVLFGAEQWAAWEDLAPDVPDYIRLIKELWRRYGVGLGEVLASFTSSAADGAISRPTSPRMASTRAASGSRARRRT